MLRQLSRNIVQKNCIRELSSTSLSPNDNVTPMFNNRNPRNLERLRIAFKPLGYKLNRPGIVFWHKVELEKKPRYIKAKIIHHQNGTVIEASTGEWALKKQLYKCTDTSAYVNLGRVLADRCIKAGITEVACFLEPKEGGKMQKFLQNLEEGGVTLKESDYYRPHGPWELERPEKPWETFE